MSLLNYLTFETRNGKNYENVDNKEFVSDDEILKDIELIDLDLSKNLYNEAWFDNLDINLTKDEQKKLKDKITTSEKSKNSILSDLLNRNKLIDDKCSFKDIGPFLPKDKQKDYALACKFDDFQYLIKLVYNNIVYNKKFDEEIKEKFFDEKEGIKSKLKITPEEIKELCKNFKDNSELEGFLTDCFKYLEKIGDENTIDCNEYIYLENCIKERERKLKKERAKTLHPNDPESDKSINLDDYHFDYRFDTAKKIINDILR